MLHGNSYSITLASQLTHWATFAFVLDMVPVCHPSCQNYTSQLMRVQQNLTSCVDWFNQLPRRCDDYAKIEQGQYFCKFVWLTIHNVVLLVSVCSLLPSQACRHPCALLWQNGRFPLSLPMSQVGTSYRVPQCLILEYTKVEFAMRFYIQPVNTMNTHLAKYN